MRTVVTLVALAIGVTLAWRAMAQSPPPTSRPTEAPGATAREDARVDVPAPSQKAVRFYRTGIAIWLGATLWAALVPWMIVYTGLSARLRDLAARVAQHWYLKLVVYVSLLTLLLFVVDLPLSFYRGFVRQHEYGLSNQTLGKWTGDQVKELLLGLLATPLVIWIPYLFLRKSPRRWWFYSGLSMIPITVFLLVVTPVLVDPLFNDFGPMKEKNLERKILGLAERAGVSGSRVFEVEKSVDTKAVNAYVTGFGGTKRIVLWDTLLGKLEDEEVLAVMAHEIGHFVLGHVRQFVLYSCLGTMIGLFLVHRFAAGLMARYRQRFRFDELSDPAALPLVLLLFGVVSFVLSPFLLAVSRHNEHEADRFALELTRDNHAAATSFVKLQLENLAVPRPHPIMTLLRSSHPTLGERIDFANDYRPWEKGEPLRYGDLFTAPPQK